MARILDYKTQKAIREAREIVGFDFTNLDEVRQVARESIAEIQLQLRPIQRRTLGRRLYDRSSFYIGRRVSNFRFINPNIPLSKMGDMIGRIQDLYPDYKIYKYLPFSGSTEYTVIVYTRGDRGQ